MVKKLQIIQGKHGRTNKLKKTQTNRQNNYDHLSKFGHNNNSPGNICQTFDSLLVVFKKVSKYI